MVQPPLNGHESAPLVGRKLYSPEALAAYAAFTSLPVAYVLYGLNVRARGQRSLGLWWVCFGAACLTFLAFMPERYTRASGLIFGAGVFGAISMLRLENRPFALAMAQGASRARWWPPALIVLFAYVALWLARWLMASVA